jgi:hypothetical protein
MVICRPVMARALGSVPALPGDERLQVPPGDRAALMTARPRIHGDPAARDRRQAQFAPPRFAARLRTFAFKTTGTTK